MPNLTSQSLKIIIAGSRDIVDFSLITQAATLFEKEIAPFKEVVSGGARGVDRLGEQYAKTRQKTLKIFPANWELYRNAAGPIRNIQMAEYADGLIAVWDGFSSGTKHMIEEMKKRQKPTLVFIPEKGHEIFLGNFSALHPTQISLPKKERPRFS